jgi:hypothetical protein
VYYFIGYAVETPKLMCIKVTDVLEAGVVTDKVPVGV